MSECETPATSQRWTRHQRVHTDDAALAPALVAALKRCTHGAHVSDALERVVDTAIRHVDQHLLRL